MGRNDGNGFTVSSLRNKRPSGHSWLKASKSLRFGMVIREETKYEGVSGPRTSTN